MKEVEMKERTKREIKKKRRKGGEKHQTKQTQNIKKGKNKGEEEKGITEPFTGHQVQY